MVKLISEQKFGGTTPEQDRKIERCVLKLKAAGTPKSRAIAICKAAVLKADKKEKQNLTKQSFANEALWTRKFINNLPDSSFALILPGGKKDKEGKTVPRSLRKLPYKGTNGKIDLPHLRNALARLAQMSNLSLSQKRSALRKLKAAAKKAGVGVVKK